MPLSDKEIEAECEKVWRVANSWGLSYWDLIRLSYCHGEDGKGSISGLDDRPGDIVYEHPVTGGVMTRFMCHEWITSWHSFYDGFRKAWRLMEEKHNL